MDVLAMIHLRLVAGLGVLFPFVTCALIWFSANAQVSKEHMLPWKMKFAVAVTCGAWMVMSVVFFLKYLT